MKRVRHAVALVAAACAGAALTLTIASPSADAPATDPVRDLTPVEVTEPTPDPAPEVTPAPEVPEWELVCGPGEWANDDLTACVPLPTEPTPVDRCEEDEPCWDCHVMGNWRCGPEPTPTPEPEPAYDEPSTVVGDRWGEFLIGDVIVCPPGLEVSIDVTPAGTPWAACM